VISHDRWFLDRICTHILACEGELHWEFYPGNYRDQEEDKKRRLGEEAHSWSRSATTKPRFSPTRFIRRHETLVPSFIAVAAADKHYSFVMRLS
jgi:ATPase subunit of ABC transporter with duplicated ATPase domains